ncbi:MAG TPA: LysR family transcriptional regulator [Kineosporiaceae bacterium]|nr:LysR family transcriptional regulator [Kineosporiaceae bacterium]
MNTELRQLRALVAIADHGTFTDAAIELGVSQASVSRTIAALEAGLGVRLLRRTTRSVSPTVVGARLITRARRILVEVAELERVAEDGDGDLRLGYAWAAFGRHTAALQRAWATEHPRAPMVLVQSNTPTAGLAEGLAEVSVVRRQLDDRFQTVQIATESSYAAVAADDPLAKRRFLRMADFAGRTIGIDTRTGTTTMALWEPGAGPAVVRETGSVDEWLTLIAAGQAVGLTSEATVAQYPRPGVVYRPVRDAQPMPVWLAWWRDDPPALHPALVRLACDVLSGAAGGRSDRAASAQQK